MDADDISQIIFLLILLALSAFFSSSETALTTVNKIRMRTLAEAGNTKAKKVLKVTENSPKMLSAILIGNNIVNLSASSLTTSLAIKLFGNVGAGVATGILTFLILIFGEVSPKTLATIKADKISKVESNAAIEALEKKKMNAAHWCVEQVNTWTGWKTAGFEVLHGAKALFQVVLIHSSKGDSQTYRASFFGASQVKPLNA